jgi:hypothetical protein
MNNLGGLRDDGNGDWRGLLGVRSSNRFLEIFQRSRRVSAGNSGADRGDAQIAVPAGGQPLLGGVRGPRRSRVVTIYAPSVKQTAGEIVGCRRDQRSASRATTTTTTFLVRGWG